MTQLDDALAAYLLDAAGRPGARARMPDGVAAGAPGLLSRLFAAFPGDPVGGGQNIDVAAAAHGLIVPDGASSALVGIEATSVRMGVDGKAVAAGTGVLLAAGTLLLLTGRPTLQTVSFIGTGAGALVAVAYFD